MCISQSDYPDLLIESDSLQELRTREQLDYGYDHLDVARDLIRSWKLPETWSTLIQCCQSPTPTSAPPGQAKTLSGNICANAPYSTCVIRLHPKARAATGAGGKGFVNVPSGDVIVTGLK